MATWMLGLARVEGQARGEEVQPKDIGREPKLTVVTQTSHCDWAWGHSRAWHEGRYAEMIRQYLLIMREHLHYVWQLETVNEQLLPFLAKARQDWPELINEFWQRVKEGRIEVVCGYSNPRLSEIYPEMLVRNLVLGKEYFRRHVPELEQKVYNAVDLMCGPSQMPQLLAQAGYRYFMFQRRDGPQATFWRHGLDGTRMLSTKCISVAMQVNDPPTSYGQVVYGIQPVPLWRIGVGMDDVLPDPALARQATSWDPSKKILSTLARFFEQCEKYRDQITVLEGPLDSLNYYTSAGLHGNHNLFTHNNQNEDLLLSLEKAQVMATMLDKSFFNEPMDGLWQDLLSCAGHAIEWIWKADYEERLAMSDHTRTRARRALEEALCAITSSIPFRNELGTPLVVFNFHGWPLSGLVEFVVDGDPKGLALGDAAGNPVPLQLLAGEIENGGCLAFTAGEIPACGFKTYYLSRTKESGPVLPTTTSGSSRIENEYYRIGLRPDGKLEVFDKDRGALLGATEAGGLGDLTIYDLPPTATWVHNGPPGRRREWQVQAERCQSVQGPVFASLRAVGTIGPHRINREVRLERGSRRIEFGVEIDAQADNGIFCIRFPVGLAGKVVAGIPFGVEPRENLDREPFRNEGFVLGFPEGYDGTRWTDVSGPEYGYTFVCPPGMHTGYAFKRQDQSLEFILLRFQPMPQDVFRQSHPSLQGKGRHRWQCALVPHSGTWREARSYRQAWEQHVPLLAYSPSARLGRGVVCAAEAPDRPQPDSPPPEAGQPGSALSLVEVAPANVVLSSMRLVKSEGIGQVPEYELRLYETTGSPAEVMVRLGGLVRQVRPTNFLGEPSGSVGKIEIEGKEIHFRIQPWQIVTLSIKGAQ